MYGDNFLESTEIIASKKKSAGGMDQVVET
jgi:hypothetical protein